MCKCLTRVSLYSDRPYSKFKPGQTSLTRDYYSAATKEAPDGAKNLENYARFKSDYGKNTSEGTKVGDYVVPSQDANTLCKFKFKFDLMCDVSVGYDLGHDPALYQHTRRAKDDASKTGTMQTSLSDAGRQALSN